MMGFKVTTLASKFYAGRFAEIISEKIDGPSIPGFDASTSVYLIGSLSFLSRINEAEALFAKYRQHMTDQERFESAYYVATALRRERRRTSTAKAKAMLIDMVRELRRLGARDHRMEFFLYCGIAFHRYIDGRFDLALSWSQRAYDSAFSAGFPFGRLVAYDMIGHSQLIVGQIRAGLKNLESSALIAESLGQGAIRQAVDVASRLYKSTYGMGRAKDLLDDLEGAIRACAFENSYTLASLYIEKARLQILSGDGHLAEHSLREAGEWVYRLDIPFLDAHLSFRFAHLSYLQGDYSKALDLIRAAKNRASDAQSASITVGILGLERRILRALNREDDADALVAEVRDLGKKSGQIISQRINCREGITVYSVVRHGEDLLGDLLDDIQKNALDVRPRVIKSGFLGLLPSMVGVSQYSDSLIFGFDGESVTIITKGFVRHDRDGWPDLMRKLFLAFAESRQLNKEDIAEKVWRQTYNPTRHDPLIYALMARVRKTLEHCEHWLQTTDGVYRLLDSVVIKDVTRDSKTPLETSPSGPRLGADLIPADVSIRQAKILEICLSRGSISNRDVCDLFQVSEVTAGRDLADLAEKGHLRRVGKGRATSYTKV
jgi:hypothetical protein